MRWKDIKICKLQITRSLFGWLLYLATELQLDLSKVFSYPLTAVPTGLAWIDGSMDKTDKSTVLKNLEKRVDTVPPVTVDACIVDAMFLMRNLSNLPATFGGVARVILKKLYVCSEEVHFVCDTFRSPLIKDIEHNKPGATNREIAITGPDQQRPKDFSKALHSWKFKTSLFRFLAKEWQKDDYKIIIEDHKLYIGF